MIKQKKNERIGNDCMIYENISIQEVGSKYAVVSLISYQGSNIEDNFGYEVKPFNTLEEAEKYYNGSK
jgi:hypothetical protein